ncbi:hypothetical protein TRFO_20309 [Tritrichomonas foetus]|uniref:Clu domain-containing protein n=1 Tax=Tritrichomonas foetus TaxID=1144522 RepID=A0A1J4KGB9_9EUKA|nr:hypothetical protein TRFO_20309 [Tritrichomonas foetus]|eukprot:OHT10425.1 hypothetical protein TRFO_20309 [Tritrichomonas foetus]
MKISPFHFTQPLQNIFQKMSENENTQKSLSVNVIAPQLKPVKLQVTPPDVATINLLFRVHPDLVFITNYDLISKSGSIFAENYDISKDVENGGELTINVKYLPYSEITALDHAQTLARILFSMSSHRQCSDCSQSVVGWITRTFANSAPSLGDLDGIYPSKYVNSSLPRPVKYLDIDRDQLSAKEQVSGCLLKLRLVTYEKTEFTVYACENGWFAKSLTSSSNSPLNSPLAAVKIFPTLHLLLCDVSKFYNDNYYLISEKWCQLRSAERQSYFPLNNSKLFMERKLNSKGQLIERSRLQLFNNKIDTSYLTNMTLDDIIDDAKSAGASELVINKLETQYANKAVEAVSAIKRGCLVPYCVSSSYLYQDLFISSIETAADLYKDKGGLATANHTICNEVHSYTQLTSDNNTFRVVRPICVDFFTNRYIAQTIIPGLISHRSQIVYGYNPENHNEFNVDPNVNELLKNEVSAKLGIAPSQVKGSTLPLFTSSETNGVASIDGFFYLSDYKRSTPRDANYTDPVKHHGCVIRPEAVASYSNYTALEKNADELTKLGGDREFLFHQNPAKQPPLSDEQIKKLEERRQQIIEKAERQLFDINALTLDSSLKAVPQNIKDLAKFVLEILIPRFIKEFADASTFIIDGKTIINEMHARGINARYLGTVHSTLEKQPKSTSNEYFLLSVDSEIIARSFKYLMRQDKANLDVLLNNLNNLVGLSSKFDQNLWNKVSDVAFERFGFKPAQPQESQRLLIIRSVLSSFGVTLYAPTLNSPLNSPLTASDVGMISPLVKFPFSRNAKFSAAVDLATTIFSEGDIDQAFTLFNVALQLAEGTVDPFDRGIATCYFYMSLIFDQKGDAESAFNAAITSLIIQEKHSDQLSPEIVIRYSLLARFAKLTQNNNLAFAFADRAASLARIISPNHPWVAIEYSVAADLALILSSDFALKYAEAKIGLCAETEEGKRVQALFRSTMSKAQLQLQKYQSALENAQKAAELDPSNEEFKRACDLIKNSLESAK